MIIRHLRASTIATAITPLLIGIMIAAPLVPSAVAAWLGVAAIAMIAWPFCVDHKSPASIAVTHLGVFADCFAVGVHDEHRTVWLTLLATLAALPLAWAFRRGGRAAKAAAGLVLSTLTFAVFVWTTEQLDDQYLSMVPQFLLFGTAAGILMIIQAVRPAKPPETPSPAAPAPPPRPPARPSWSRDVT